MTTSKRLLTCPETAHLEVLVLESTPCGSLVAGCSRLAREPGLECARDCARRLDLRDRRGADDREERVLVMIAEADRLAPLIAHRLAELLARDALHVEVAVAGDRAPPPDDYDCIVLAGRARFGTFPAALLDYARRHQVALGAMPAALVTIEVGHSPAMARIAPLTGWSPTRSLSVAPGATAGELQEVALAIAELVPSIVVAPAVAP